MEENTFNNVLVSIGELFDLIADGIHKIFSEWDRMNNAGVELTPVLPHQPVKSDIRTYVQCVNVREVRLRRRFSKKELSKLD